MIPAQGRILTTIAAIVAGLVTLSSQGPAKRTMYVVSTAHLDSQWNWTVQDTIRDYLPKTLHDKLKRLGLEPDAYRAGPDAAGPPA